MFHYSTNKALVIACLLSIFALTFIVSAQQPDFRVTEASLTSDKAQVSGPCPINVVFNGYIATDGPGTVRYTFTRSDGATGPTFEMVFKEAGRQSVSTEWTLGDASALPRFEGWRALRILAPNEIESSHETGSFSITCAAQGSGQMATAPIREQTPRVTEAQPCRLYGEQRVPASGTSSVADGCNRDSSITSVQSGFYEGISPDLPGNSPERRGAETTIAFVPRWTDVAGPPTRHAS